MTKCTLYPGSWADMSNYLVHFAKGGTAAKGRAAKRSRQGDDSGYNDMMGILFDRSLRPGPFGIGRKIAPDIEQQKVVCLSEVPPGEWLRLSEHRKSQFGIGFSKSFIAERGGGPIWYAKNESRHHKALKKLMKLGKDDPEHPIWSITSMIDAPGVYGRRSYQYEWEREWRHIGALAFEPEDVAFLFIPEELHSIARMFFLNALHNHTGPAYFCPFIDVKWPRTRVEEELRKDFV